MKKVVDKTTFFCYNLITKEQRIKGKKEKQMTKKVYYIENTNEANNAIERIINNFPTFVDVETIEMNYIQLTIECREEDLKAIENILKDFV